jgi:hypothetical protein
MTSFDLLLIFVVPVAAGADLLFCYRRTPAYFRSILPLIRRRVEAAAHDTPVETWLDDADNSRRGRWAELDFARLSNTEVGFWEPWRVAAFVFPLFIAGRVIETPQGHVELVAGPRWIIPIIWTWSLLGPGPEWDTPVPILLGIAVLAVYALHHVRIAVLTTSLREGSKM